MFDALELLVWDFDCLFGGSILWGYCEAGLGGFEFALAVEPYWKCL